MVLPAGCQLCEQLLTGASRLPVCEDCLASFSRWEAVRGAFATRPGSQVDKRRVLLVDDVMTTGATLDACAKALREAGASSVLGLTVARAILNPQKVSR